MGKMAIAAIVVLVVLPLVLMLAAGPQLRQQHPRLARQPGTGLPGQRKQRRCMPRRPETIAQAA